MQKPPILKGDESQQLLQLREYLWKLSEEFNKLEKRIEELESMKG